MLERIAGWFARSGTVSDAAALIQKLLAQQRRGLPAYTAQDQHVSASMALGVGATGESPLLFSDADCHVALLGQPRWTSINHTSSMNLAAEIAERFRTEGPDFLSQLHGTFALAIVRPAHDEVLLATDRMGICPLAYASFDGGIVFASTVDAFTAFPLLSIRLNSQAIYDYLYFSMVPSPGTIYHDIYKLEPGQYLHWGPEGAVTDFYWHPQFGATSTETAPALQQRLRTILQSAVHDADATCEAGAFLSGGLDSSTVAGMLAKNCAQRPKTFSIGFSAEGYDEIHYARIAAHQFKTEAHEYYVTPDDVAQALPIIASAYDEPFGNASAIPAYCCAKLAKQEGLTTLLAGDGGDELFAGNARYAKQKIFEFYYRLPRSLRLSLVEPILFRLSSRLPLFRKAQSYVRQARVPLPDRLETYNFLHLRPAEEMFTPEFLKTIDTNRPLQALRNCYRRPRGGTTLDRMLYLDWKFTLADNDLRKVSRTCEIAGIAVRYPMLDDNVVEFSTRVPTRWKLKGLELRDFYKRAMQGFLPDEILTKPKHGFGLPFGVWLKESSALQDIVSSAMQRMRNRNIILPAYIDWVVDRHRHEHADFYGVMLWMLVMLEQWLDTHGH